MDMWAQLIRIRLKPGENLAEMTEQIRAAEQPGSGLLRTLVMRDQADPSRIYTLVVFESEEKARAREQDPRRTERLEAARSIMADILDGPPEFTDLEVIDEWIDGTA
jgi:quinol monooxygenase YgiN